MRFAEASNAFYEHKDDNAIKQYNHKHFHHVNFKKQPFLARWTEQAIAIIRLVERGLKFIKQNKTKHNKPVLNLKFIDFIWKVRKLWRLIATLFAYKNWKPTRKYIRKQTQPHKYRSEQRQKQQQQRMAMTNE